MAGNAWHFLLKREAKKALAAAPSAETEPSEPTAPTEDAVEKVAEPESAETVVAAETALVVPEANQSGIVLAQLEKVLGLLAEVRTVSQAREVLAAAKAVEIYAREMRVSADILVGAFRVRSLAKRQLGETIVKMQEAGELEGRGGDRKSKSTPATLKLRDLAISKSESARAQEFASVSEEEFERMLGEAGSGEELSDKALLRRIRAAKSKAAATTTSNSDKSGVEGAGKVALAILAQAVEKEFARTAALWRQGHFEPFRKRVTEEFRWAAGEKKLDAVVRLMAEAERLLHELAIGAETARAKGEEK
jgi:hypothetical protein